jgi:hypothetical protein
MQITVTYGKGFEPKPHALAIAFGNMGLSTVEVTKEKIVALQDVLLEMPQADIVTTHTFKPQVYERMITVPKWTVLTGAAHKTPYKVRLEKGTIAVNVGTEVKILTGPYEFDACAGEQRVGRVFDEEVVWVDIYDNFDNCADISVLEDRLYVVPECGLLDNRQKLIAAKQKQLMLEGEL